MKENTPHCRFLLVFCQGETGLIVGQPALMPETLEKIRAIGRELRDAAICRIAPWPNMPCLQTAGAIVAQNWYRQGSPEDDFDLALLDGPGWQDALDVWTEDAPPTTVVNEVAETLSEVLIKLDLGTGELIVLPPRIVNEVLNKFINDPNIEDIDLGLGEGIILIERDGILYVGEIYSYHSAA